MLCAACFCIRSLVDCFFGSHSTGLFTGIAPLNQGEAGLNRFLMIAVGAALGANARYLIGLWAGNRFGADFPYGTLIVNVSGSFALGFLFTLGAGRLQLAPETRLLLAVGFLGSFTTFSSYALESMNLWREAGLWRTLLNIVGNNLVGLGGVVSGAALARWLQGGG
jgi:fluoride exporter